ncbi:hypothetical protein UPYG_G00130550 [Umbra pygmaea]|uniref:FDX-ACB domain-containing protein n=1 Tax=Umbra pygmaea TaxID=75934 RepID=A0ABD0XRZ5_UMBPY
MMSSEGGSEVLLVGEGNFSFSAALSCDVGMETDDITSGKCLRITATCLQTREEALRHLGSAHNIDTVTQTGGEVLFGVDATRLPDRLGGRRFDCVIFNFPHCGRKSSVKKNRVLLKHFFLSCVEVLKEEGKVLLSLCNGQGGTPADQPMREWHNSWQVVVMAAEAGLILNEVRPFDSEKLLGYKPTGYRSQDKSFHAERGVTHVFSRSVDCSSPRRKELMLNTVGGDTLTYYIPVELSNYINRGFLCSESVHPVRLVQDFLVYALEEEWPVSMVTEPLPLIIRSTPQRLKACCPEIKDTHTHCYWLHPPHTHTTHLDQLKHTDSLLGSMTDPHAGHPSGEHEGVREGNEANRDGFLLRPSMLPQMEEMLREQLERREELLREQQVRNRGWRELMKNNRNGGTRRKEICSTERQREELRREQLEQREESRKVLHGVSGLVLQRIPISPWTPPAFHQLLLRGECHNASHTIAALGRSLERLLARYGVSLAVEQEYVWLIAEPMGRLGWMCSHIDTDDIIVCLNLDLLASLLYSVPDWRLLWSSDHRFLNHFLLRPLPGQPFRPFSLFPQSFVYDISFWAWPDWQEAEFHAVVREASEETVEDVTLIDTYTPSANPHNTNNTNTDLTSYCYRLTYRSHTQALSHTRALKLHAHLQSLLSKRLSLTVR